MIYVNTTGKHIGECLTGFGSSYPVIIYNSGNSDVKYDIDVLSNTDNFFVSKDSFIINNGFTGGFDIFYKPTIVGSTADEDTEITIFGQSVEDGSTDPSGVITLEITGSRIISNTAGAVRRFVAVKNYDAQKGINYDFKWLPPTGTGNLKNYYFTGYKLELSTAINFSSIVYEKEIVIQKNTNDNPRFATYYGFPESEIIENVSKKDYPELDLDIPYYARVYTNCTNNSGISIYATGIENPKDQLSEEVINGNSGIKVNLEFNKKALNVYLEEGDYINYDLSDKVIKTNNGSSDLLFYSSINIYFPNNSSFTSSDYNNYAVSFNNIVFSNFDGGSAINFYIPYNCRILGNFGKGGDIITSQSIDNYSYKLFQDTSNLYNKKDSTISDSQAGGNVFALNIKNNNNITNFIYNLFVEKNSLLLSGGGGNKAGLAFLANIQAKGNDNKIYNSFFPLNGAFNKFGAFTKYDLLDFKPASQTQFLSGPPQMDGSFFSKQSSYGEDGSDKAYINYTSVRTSNWRRVGYSEQAINTYQESIGYANDVYPTLQQANKTVDYTLQFKAMPGSVSTAGNLVKKYNDSSVRLSYYNTDIPSDYIFRLENSFLTNSPSLAWAAKSKLGSTIFTLNTPSPSGLTYSANYNSTGYKALTIKNGYFSGNISAVSDSFKNFDLYIVGCFNRPINEIKFSKMINWYKNSTNSSSKNVLCKNFANTNINNFSKESKIFNFFFSLLYEYKIENNNADQFFLFNKSAASSYYQLSSCLSTASYDIYPFILNIKRNGTFYSIYVNGDLHTVYDLNFETTSQFRNSTNFLSSILNTTFRLENDDATVSNGITTTFFDLICFNRVLFDDENKKVHNNLINSYIKLFSGDSSNDYLNINARIRLPNIFNTAGYIST